MLVLSRYSGEKLILVLPDKSEVEICILDVNKGKVRIGIVAATEIGVFREEVLNKIKNGEDSPREKLLADLDTAKKLLQDMEEPEKIERYEIPIIMAEKE